VAEEADGRLDVREGLGRVELAENVVVLVEGRAVADGNRVMEELRALLLAEEKIIVFLQDLFFGPEDCRGGDGV